ncbi:hypothetical protein VNO77_05037 [Canavalia gladiata]|uniref:Uncharacterized protein n=1 Tax=Canavalia gladiata TaxID=3824 RepID=A0AAN9R8A5_CANGL
MLITHNDPFMFTQEGVWYTLVPSESMYQSAVFGSCANFLVYAVSNEMDCCFTLSTIHIGTLIPSQTVA